jgi:hypothetical protein
MKDSITRRTMIQGGLAASLVVPALIGARAAAAAALTPLDAKDPQAVTLGFVSDASKVDAAANPNYSSGQTCSNCQQYQGTANETQAGCVLFPGKSVPAAGWCKVWRNKV